MTRRCRLSPTCLLASAADHALLDDARTPLPWTITTVAALLEDTAPAETGTATATVARVAIITMTVLAIDLPLVVPWKTTLHLLLAVATMIPTDAITLPLLPTHTPMGDPHMTDPLEISLLLERQDTHEMVAILETMTVVDATGKSISHYRFGRLLGGTVLDRRCARSTPTNMPNGVKQSRPVLGRKGQD